MGQLVPMIYDLYLRFRMLSRKFLCLVTSFTPLNLMIGD